MFDALFDTVKGTIDDLSTSVDIKIKEAQDQITSDNVYISFIELVDEASDSISKLLTNDKEHVASPLPRSGKHFSASQLPPDNKTNNLAPSNKSDHTVKQRSSHSSSRSSSRSHDQTTNHLGGQISAGSRSNVGSDDDLLGYNLSDESEEECEESDEEEEGGEVEDDEEEEDELCEMPMIKPRSERCQGPSSNKMKPRGEHQDNSSESDADDIPRYGLPSVYLNPSEICQRRVTTTRRITEADLDENSPLYRHRKEILGNDILKKGPASIPATKTPVLTVSFLFNFFIS